MKRLLMCVTIALMCVITPQLALAQGKELKGVVVDASGLPVIGASVAEVGTVNGTMTDIQGQYMLTVKDNNAVVEISFIGYKTVQLVASSAELAHVTLQEDAMGLDEVVVIGYGAVKKNDMTGSVIAVKAEELNRGALTSPQELLRGKVPGVNIVSGNGAPGAGAEIRIRGGASLSAYNDPLIVIDGVPVAREAGVGMSNGLATVNPNDIESFTVLKDASATAIYGSRASNGVILITTKKGSNGAPRVSYNGSVSVKHNYNTMDMMNAAEFKEHILTVAPDLANKSNALFGEYDTDWQKEIFRLGIATDHNVSVTGSAAENKLPYRASVGYVYDGGTIKGSDNQRVNADISLAPKFLKDHLSLNFNAKGIYNRANYVDGGVVGSAVYFDPTQSPYNYMADGSVNTSLNNGYYNWSTDLTATNPLSMIYDQYDANQALRAIGNIQLDYKVHGFEDLSFNLNLGLDATSTNGNKGNRPGSIYANRDGGDNGAYKTRGRYTTYNNLHVNQLLEFYANYKKEIGIHNINAMLGYSWSKNHSETTNSNFGRIAPADPSLALFDVTQIGDTTYSASRNALVSFYGRFNYSIDSRYLFTFTMRADGSSRFVGKNRWGYFPSAAFAWNVKEEAFLEDSEAISTLKFRLGYGQTGQQEIGNYKYLARYSVSENDLSHMANMGSDGLSHMLAPAAYDPNIRWETTITYNAGLDFGFFDGLVDGSVDVYRRDTKDLLNWVTTPMGANFGTNLLTNVGSMRNQGVEFSLNFNPIRTSEWSLRFGFNGTFQDTKFTKLNNMGDEDYAIFMNSPGTGTGGNDLQAHKVGYAPYTFYVFEQGYDENGNPIQNGFVDRSGDGKISEDDRYFSDKTPAADFFFGVNLKLSYKNWDFGFNGHGSVGNYVFNSFYAQHSSSRIDTRGGLSNFATTVLRTGWTKTSSPQQDRSDLYLENASFFRMDDINLGYTFGKLGNSDMKLRVAAGVQNVFVLTKYSGVDPEVSGVAGIDGTIWPRPRTYSVRLNLSF